MPAPPARIREEDFVPLAQLYGREARVFTEDWREITPPHRSVDDQPTTDDILQFEVVASTHRDRHHGQGWILAGRGNETRSVGHEQIRDIMRSAKRVEH